jgi:hypothetical protein
MGEYAEIRIVAHSFIALMITEIDFGLRPGIHDVLGGCAIRTLIS